MNSKRFFYFFLFFLFLWNPVTVFDFPLSPFPPFPLKINQTISDRTSWPEPLHLFPDWQCVLQMISYEGRGGRPYCRRRSATLSIFLYFLKIVLTLFKFALSLSLSAPTECPNHTSLHFFVFFCLLLNKISPSHRFARSPLCDPVSLTCQENPYSTSSPFSLSCFWEAASFFFFLFSGDTYRNLFFFFLLFPLSFLFNRPLNYIILRRWGGGGKGALLWQ